MKFFQGFLHFNIRCSEEDLPLIEKFYGDVLDLRIGPRPDFAVPGIWLYCEDDPILHVVARFKKGAQVKDYHNSSIDHIAWKASGAVEFRNRLQLLDVEFEEQNIKDAGYQVFLYDPVGTKLEFNFANEHVPDAVPLGITAQTNLR